jgi:hypothetical protein
MKGLKITSIITTVFLIVLELIPFSIKLNWVDSGGMSSTSYHSYFESIPWGRGVVGPLICAILSVILLSLLLLSFFIENNKAFYITLCALPWLALLGSLSAMISDSYTLLGGIIGAVLIVLAELIQFIYSKTFNKD